MPSSRPSIVAISIALTRAQTDLGGTPGTYKGEKKNGKRHGKGTYTYPDGCEYYGDWVDKAQKALLLEQLRGLRGRKLVWWLDSPLPGVALALARRMPLDVVVMDVRMPRVGGLAAAERIRTDAQVREQGGPPGIVLMTALDLEDFVGPSAEVGADALLYKDVEPEALLAAVLAAATTGRARA